MFKKIFNADDGNLPFFFVKIIGSAFFVFGLTIPFSITTNHISLFLIILSWFCLPNSLKSRSLSIKNNFLIASSTFLFLTTVSLIYFKNIDEAGAVMERNIFFVLVALTFYLLIFNYQQFITRFAQGFIIGNLINGLNVLFIYYNAQSLLNESLTDEAIQNILPMHATYMAFFFASSIIILVRNILNQVINHLLSWVLIAFFSIIIVLIGSKMGILFLCIVFVYFFYQLFVKNFNFRIVATTCSLFICLIILGSKNDIIAYRFASIMSLNFQRHPVKGFNTFSGRIFFWRCASKIIERNFLFGVGVGNAQRELDLCYLENEPTVDEKFLNTYNAHNQFLQIFLEYGLFGIIILLSIFYAMINCSIKTKFSEGFILALMFFLFFLTESALNRDKGIVPFSFLACAIYAQAKEKNKGDKEQSILSKRIF